MPQRNKHLLVDLENVQPAAAAVAAWMGAEGKAWIFYAPQQRKLLPAFEALGTRVTLVPISRPGSNSLDFHLVFYLGHLAARHPESEFTVLSQDKGYDPAVAHARELSFKVKRVRVLPGPPRQLKKTEAKPTAGTPVKKKSSPKPLNAIYRNVLQDLKGPGRPGSLIALRRHIQTKMGTSPAPDLVQAIIDRLTTVDEIQVIDEQLAYVRPVPSVEASA